MVDGISLILFNISRNPVGGVLSNGLKLDNWSGEYYFVLKTVQRIENNKTKAPK